MSVVPTVPDPAQQSLACRLLESLDRLVQRHRTLAMYGGEHAELHAELIVTELAHELAMARSALHRSHS